MAEDDVLAAMDVRPGASQIELESLERWMGAPLPVDYRTFLERSNGGWLRGPLGLALENERTIRLEGGAVGGAGEDGELSIRRRTEALRAADVGISRDVIWFMDDGCGGFLLIGVRGASGGRVYYCDHELIGPDDTARFEQIAPSFTELMRRLAPLQRKTPWWRRIRLV